jgi:hypothetical protein
VIVAVRDASVVSVTVSVCGSAVSKVTLKTWLPASAAVNV